jgi:hypothetical protein
MSFIKDVKLLKRTSPLIYLLFIILPLMIRIIVLVTLLFLEICASTRLNSLNFFLENYDSDRDGRGYFNLSLISSILSSSNGTRSLGYLYSLR